MATTHGHLLLQLLAVVALLSAGETSGGGFGFDLHHRFSPVVRRWAEARGHRGEWWPSAREGSPEYYSALSRHDRVLLSRRSLAGDGLLTFANGNATVKSIGFLHYAEVTIGTPNVTFLVALDTGSDLFWVPCDCKHCGPGNLTVYSPTKSSTSRTVTCSNSLCDGPNACTTANSSCPYVVRYVSANTSSSGVLVEDFLYLTKEGAAAETVKAPIVFGCGQEQTGIFIDGAAANGLLGLGLQKVAVPSVLASRGLVSNTFSMCFSPDGAGRINFGDGGNRNQSETPFLVSNVHPTYNISITSINLEEKAVPVDFTAAVDSGTSFTYLNDPAYTKLTTNFNAQIREKRANFSLPFEYCYAFSPNQSTFVLPDVSLTTKGGALFPVTRPYVIIAEEKKGQFIGIGYCLAVLKNDISINIIGQNFMTGLKVVFDRERFVLGWQKFDCYKSVSTEGLPDGGPAPAPGPAAVKQQNKEAARDPTAAQTPPQPRSSGHLNRALGGLSLLPLLLAAIV